MSTFWKFALAAIAIVNISMLTRLAASPGDDEKQNKQKDESKDHPMVGAYSITSGEMDGKTVPPEQLKGSTVIISADRIVSTDKDKKEFFSCTYTLTNKDMPWRIKMKSTNPKEGDAVGLVKKENGTITMIYSLPGGPDPTEFKTKEKQHLFVLKPLVTK